MSEIEQNALNAEVVAKPKKKSSSKKKTDTMGFISYDEFTLALSELQKETMVPSEDIFNLLIEAMKQAYLEISYPELKDKSGRDDIELLKKQIQCKIVFTKKAFEIYDLKVITPDDDIIDDAYQISPEDYYSLTKKDADDGTVVEIPFDVSTLDKSFARRTKQLFQGKLKDASKQAILSAYKDQMGQLIEGTVTKAEADSRTYEVSFGKASSFIKKDNRKLLPSDHFSVGDKVLFYLERVNDTATPPSLEVNRTSPMFIEKLMEREIPEVAEKIVIIKGIARDPGRRTKVFVDSTNHNIDPIGTCIGPETSRQRSISAVLKGEKIDFCKWHPNKAIQIIEAMKPAEVIGMTCPDDFFDSNVHYEEFENERTYEHPQITVIVNNGSQGIAIGSNGCNSRLASQITKCKLTVLQSDDAMQKGIKYTMVNVINDTVNSMYPDLAKPVEVKSEPVVDEADIDEEEVLNEEVKPSVENKEDVKVEAVNEPAPAVEAKVEETVVEEVKETKVEEPIEHVEIMNKPKISLDALEAAMSQKKGPSETRSYRRKKKDDDVKEVEVSEASKATAMPIYTKEELEALDEADSNDDINEYEDDEDFDQYDSDQYYDDDSGK